MSLAAKTEEEVRALAKDKHNKSCFTCGRQGTNNVILPPIGIFVCSTCAGLHRNIQHKTKDIAMSTFTKAEVDELKTLGNRKAKKHWLARLPDDGPGYDLSEPRNRERFVREVFEHKVYLARDGDAPKKKKDKSERKTTAATLSAPGSGRGSRTHSRNSSLSASDGRPSPISPPAEDSAPKAFQPPQSPIDLLKGVTDFEFSSAPLRSTFSGDFGFESSPSVAPTPPPSVAGPSPARAAPPASTRPQVSSGFLLEDAFAVGSAPSPPPSMAGPRPLTPHEKEASDLLTNALRGFMAKYDLSSQALVAVVQHSLAAVVGKDVAFAPAVTATVPPTPPNTHAAKPAAAAPSFLDDPLAGVEMPKTNGSNPFEDESPAALPRPSQPSAPSSLPFDIGFSAPKGPTGPAAAGRPAPTGASTGPSGHFGGGGVPGGGSSMGGMMTFGPPGGAFPGFPGPVLAPPFPPATHGGFPAGGFAPGNPFGAHGYPMGGHMHSGGMMGPAPPMSAPHGFYGMPHLSGAPPTAGTAPATAATPGAAAPAKQANLFAGLNPLGF